MLGAIYSDVLSWQETCQTSYHTNNWVSYCICIVFYHVVRVYSNEYHVKNVFLNAITSWRKFKLFLGVPAGHLLIHYTNYNMHITVLQKYIKVFLGTRNKPTPTTLDDFAEYWLVIKQKVNMIKYWLHLISTPHDRLIIWNIYTMHKLNNRKWSADVRSILKQCDIGVYFAETHLYTKHHFQ